MEENFSTDQGPGEGYGSGSNLSYGEQQMKLPSLASHSPPTVWPGDWMQSSSGPWGLGTSGLRNSKNRDVASRAL